MLRVIAAGFLLASGVAAIAQAISDPGAEWWAAAAGGALVMAALFVLDRNWW